MAVGWGGGEEKISDAVEALTWRNSFTLSVIKWGPERRGKEDRVGTNQCDPGPRGAMESLGPSGSQEGWVNEDGPEDGPWAKRLDSGGKGETSS